ncbi:hypothetical protein PROFUN_05364 [Planoprotostelium fungivorum]|uniref:PH domain-containing protein n=1 Tax=Planoprotostelium fungivorum TaxID=1890364 RepID=A0A2P6NR66_9EUKA|nr:hypothetical protein PROFUN_05364 [Planoprotostelium fungivorum]
MGGLKLGREAQNKYDEARQNPDHAGFLEKKGAKRKNWNARWFVMKDNYLFYSKSKKANPQGIINLHGCTVVKPEGLNSRPTCFNVLAPKSVSIDSKWTNRLYFFAAKDDTEMKDWIKAIERASQKPSERQGEANSKETAKSDPSPREERPSSPGGPGSGSDDSDEENGTREKITTPTLPLPDDPGRSD